MVLHLAARWEGPLRERDILLVGGGFAPGCAGRSLGEPGLRAAREGVDLVCAGREPSPPLAADRHWTLVAANSAVGRIIGGADAALLQPPVNVLRLSLHPQGLAPRIANLPEWRAHLLARLRRQVEVSADPVLAELMRELAAYPVPSGSRSGRPPTGREFAGVLVPVQFTTEQGILSFFSTTTVFGTPLDITLSELALEAFFPADAATADALRRLAEAAG